MASAGGIEWGLRPWCACRPYPSLIARFWRAVMGTTAMVANSTIRLSPGWNGVFYWGVWAVCIICIAIVLWAALKSPRWARWTTQDILIVAALGVLLEVYDNIIGDQLIGPLINPIPGADFSQVQDLPYLF